MSYLCFAYNYPFVINFLGEEGMGERLGEGEGWISTQSSCIQAGDVFS